MGREACLDIREGLGGPPGDLGGVGRNTPRSGMGWESHPHVREAYPISPRPLGRPPGRPGGPPDPSQTSGWASRPLRDVRVGLPTPLGPLGMTPDPSQTSGWAS